tara:strand:- start:946 stop:1917 length:972 start_codon:yes stop_codon:yes gene_type:complete
MEAAVSVSDLLRCYVSDAQTAFSVGSFGALAEFQRGTDEPCELDLGNQLQAVTARGALRIDACQPVVAVAHESISRRAPQWTHGLTICSHSTPDMISRSATIAELGPDSEAVQAQHRAALLFDLGVCVGDTRFCIRTSDDELITLLRCQVGKVFVRLSEIVVGAIVAKDPHRVVYSKQARIEVYQPIGRTRTPCGPHTHLLPRLLRSARTHDPRVRLPGGLLPCLFVHPRPPFIRQSDGTVRHDPAAAAGFAAVYAEYGDAEQLALNECLAMAIRRGEPIWNKAAGLERRRRVRLALRKLVVGQPDMPGLRPWLDRFEPALTA